MIQINLEVYLETRARWLVTGDGVGPDARFTFHDEPHSVPNKEGVYTFVPNLDYPDEASRRFDVFDVSYDLTRVKDVATALAFLQRYGPPEMSHGDHPLEKIISFSSVQAIRRGHIAALTPNAMRSDASRRVRREQSEHLLRWAQPPDARVAIAKDGNALATIQCKTFLEALRGAAFLGEASGAKWRECARSGCGGFFRVQGKRTTYCSATCARLQATIDFRSRSSDAATDAKGGR